MKRLWIIADDLTGAIDTGIKFADQGILTCVLPFGAPGTFWEPGTFREPGTFTEPGIFTEPSALTKPSAFRELGAFTEPGTFKEPSAFKESGTFREPDDCREPNASEVLPNAPEVLPDAPVVVINTMSRHDTPKAAKGKIKHILCQAQKANVDYIYKKTDATLRGNIGAELGEMAACSETNTVAFLPSFPEMGRTVRDGICYVNGIPLKDTHMAKDPFTPVKHSRVRDVIAEQTELPVIECKSDYTIPEKLSGPCIHVLDGETREDLDLAAKMLRDCGKIRYTAGCSAFARSLLPYLGLTGQARKKTAVCKESSLLIVCGSVNETTLQQTHYAGDVLGYEVVTLTPEQKLLSEHSQKNAAFFLKMDALLKKRKKLLIRAVSDRSDMEKTTRFGNELSISPETAHLRIADHIGQLTAQLLQRNPASVAVLFGGDTLSGVIRHLGTDQIRLLGEIAPGVVDTLFLAGENQYRVITKSGALGGREVVRVIEDYLS